VLVKTALRFIIKKSPPGRGNARGARRGDKNCAALVITHINSVARVGQKKFIFFSDWHGLKGGSLVDMHVFIYKNIFFVSKKLSYGL